MIGVPPFLLLLPCENFPSYAQASAPLMIGENPGETFELEEGMWHSVGQVHKLLVLQNAQKYTFA